jgi:hypothetical protein
MTSAITAVAAVVGWLAAVVIFAQAGVLFGLPAVAGWSLSAALGVDVAWHREKLPMPIAATLVFAAALFALVAVRAI